RPTVPPQTPCLLSGFHLCLHVRFPSISSTAAPTPARYTLSLHDALPISRVEPAEQYARGPRMLTVQPDLVLGPVAGQVLEPSTGDQLVPVIGVRGHRHQIQGPLERSPGPRGRSRSGGRPAAGESEHLSTVR